MSPWPSDFLGSADSMSAGGASVRNGALVCDDDEVDLDFAASSMASSPSGSRRELSGDDNSLVSPEAPLLVVGSKSTSVGAIPNLRDDPSPDALRGPILKLPSLSLGEDIGLPKPKTLPTSLTVDRFIVPVASSLDRIRPGALSGFIVGGKTTGVLAIEDCSGSGSCTILNELRGSRIPDRAMAYSHSSETMGRFHSVAFVSLRPHLRPETNTVVLLLDRPAANSAPLRARM
jgi:hypothetical protein